MAEEKLLKKFSVDNFVIHQGEKEGGAIIAGAKVAVLLPLKVIAKLGEVTQDTNLLYKFGELIGEELYSQLSNEIIAELNLRSLAMLPFPDFLIYLNRYFAVWGMGNVSLGKEPGGLLVTHKGGPNTADTPEVLSYLYAGLFAGMFKPFAGGSLKGTPKNLLPAESVVYKLSKG